MFAGATAVKAAGHDIGLDMWERGKHEDETRRCPYWIIRAEQVMEKQVYLLGDMNELKGSYELFLRDK